MTNSNQIIVYEEADKNSIDKYIALLGDYELKSYKAFPRADAMIFFLISLEQRYDHAYVLVGEGSNSINWLSKEIKSGHKRNRYKNIAPLFISKSLVPEWWRDTKSLKYLNDILKT